MNRTSLIRFAALCAIAVALPLMGGCSALWPKAAPRPSIYSLDDSQAAAVADRPASSTKSSSATTLIVDPPQAAAGFDSSRIMYLRTPQRLEHFARSEWADTPSRMLTPMIVAALENNGGFAVVVSEPSSAAGDLLLDTEILRLQQEFEGPSSRVRFTLRATLVDNTTGRTLAWRDFDESTAAESSDAYAGVVAAHRVVQVVMEQLADFCKQSAAGWQRRPATDSAGAN